MRTMRAASSQGVLKWESRAKSHARLTRRIWLGASVSALLCAACTGSHKPHQQNTGSLPTTPTAMSRLGAIGTSEPRAGRDTLNLRMRQPDNIRAPLLGYADVHTHMFSSYGFGGSVVSPAPTAGSPCLALEPGKFLDIAGAAVRTELGVDKPTHCLPGAQNLLGQQMGEEQLLRAHRAGLNLIVVNGVNNKLLCGLLHASRWDTDPTTCDDMVNASAEIAAAHSFEKHVDEESGGAGRGWFRIVGTPEQARRAIQDGDLAVVLGFEISDPFCAGNPDTCDRTRLLADIDAAYNAGVRAVLPMHIFNNIFGGAAMHSCTANTNCSDELVHFAASGLRSAALTLGDTRFTSVNFPKTRNCSAEGIEIGGGQCNELGLTSYGQFLIDALTSRAMLIDTDHLSTLARDQILAFLMARKYPVISSHAGFREIDHGEKANESNPDAQQVAKIIGSGGVLSPILNQGTAAEVSHVAGAPEIPDECRNASTVYEFAQALHYAVVHSNGRGVPFGSDLDGFADWPTSCSPATVTYPLTINGAKFEKSSVTADGHTHVYDIATDGFAHVGMYPDFLAQLEAIGVPAADLEALRHGAEAYIETWESAVSASIPEPAECISSRAAITAAYAHHAAVVDQIQAFEEGAKDTTGPNRGKPTKEQIEERQGLQRALSDATAAIASARNTYVATAKNIRDGYLSGLQRRVCMTEDAPIKSPPSAGGSPGSSAPQPNKSPSYPNPPLNDPCRSKPYLPQC
jgi:microsomal dipeptidase-like Zn-dependent dipeptidase